jgi:hypothetical protein
MGTLTSFYRLLHIQNIYRKKNNRFKKIKLLSGNDVMKTLSHYRIFLLIKYQVAVSSLLEILLP